MQRNKQKYEISGFFPNHVRYFTLRFHTFLSAVGVPISLWLFLFPVFLFAAQPKEFFLAGLKKLEQQRHRCVELKGEYVE
jgi:hypothetical protein